MHRDDNRLALLLDRKGKNFGRVGAGVARHQVDGHGWFVKMIAGFEVLQRLTRQLEFQFSGQDVADDEAGMLMRSRDCSRWKGHGQQYNIPAGIPWVRLSQK